MRYVLTAHPATDALTVLPLIRFLFNAIYYSTYYFAVIILLTTNLFTCRVLRARGEVIPLVHILRHFKDFSNKSTRGIT